MCNYSKKAFPKKHFYLCIFLLITILICSCATKNTQFGRKATSLSINTVEDSSKLNHQIFFVGNSYDIDQNQLFFDHFKNHISRKKNSHLVFLGNTIKPLHKSLDTIGIEKDLLLRNLDFWNDYDGSIIYIPGENEWQKEGVKGLFKWQKTLLDNRPNSVNILPTKGCGLESMMLNENILMISLDSQWYLEDWNLHPNINEFCHHKTRESVLKEISFILNENQDKTIVFLTHHPIFNNGYYGGQYELSDHFFPFSNNIFLPILGTFYTYIKKAAGWNFKNTQNYRYRILFEDLKKIIKKHNNVVVVSGLEQNLQYVYQENIHQLISGSGNLFSSARAVNPYDFSYGNHGFVSLSIYENKKVNVSFHTFKADKELILFKKNILKESTTLETEQNLTAYPDSIKTSIYSKFKTRKSNTYHFLWGKHYKDFYQKELKFKTTLLDTLYGGLKPIGIEQLSTSTFITLKNKKGIEYWLIPIKKDIEDFLQTNSFEIKSEKEPFQKTITKDFLEDYFTTIYPFAALGIEHLSKEIGINSLEYKLFYIPKNRSLELFHKKIGNGIYFITQKPNSFQKNENMFGNPEFIVDTNDLLYTLQTEKEHQIDVNAYLKVRLFDMLIGDWDRDASHYKWAAKKNGTKTIYTPIPFQRDQAFAKYDGAILSVLKQFSLLGQMHHYDKRIKKTSSFNSKAYTLDLALLPHVSEKEWIDAAIYIQSHLSNQTIDSAFQKMTLNFEESKDSQKLKDHFKNRLKMLRKTAIKHHRYLEKKVLIVGSKLDDKFFISRLDKKRTQITVYQGEAIPENILFDKTYSSKGSGEIWIYGLEGNDSIFADGTNIYHSKLKIIGGQGADYYKVNAGRSVAIYDFPENNNQIIVSKKTQVYLSNDYEINGYDYKKPAYDQLNFVPLVGMNPDDGLRIGTKVEFTNKGFISKPFSQKHILKNYYYFATKGYDIAYQNTLKKVYLNWDFILDAGLTSSNFAMNFFGFGNETSNFDNRLGLDFNRVKIERFKFYPGISKNLKNGQFFSVGLILDQYKVEPTFGRFITQVPLQNSTFSTQTWTGFNIKYLFENVNYSFWPTLGLKFYGDFSWVHDINKLNNLLPSISSGLDLAYKLVPDASIIFQTKLETKFLFSNQFMFFQGATLGGDASLRGFRTERFNGKQSFMQSSDLKLNLGIIKNPFIPINYGLLLGLDYGRVWVPFETSDRWHTALGGGVWFLNNQLFKSHFSYFNSFEGGRLSFGLDFNF